MKLIPCLVCLLIGVSTQVSSDESALKVSLCKLQRGAKQGEQRSVQVDGTYYTGFEGSVLTNRACPSQSTWVKWDLRSTANEESLRAILDSTRRANDDSRAAHADVVVEGDFLGPPLPSPDLPEAIRKSYHPGWGHNGAFNTQLVVHVIRSVKAGK